MAWRRRREMGRHIVTVAVMASIVAIIIDVIVEQSIHPVAFLIITIPVLMLAGETVDLLIWSQEGLVPEVHPDALWVPTVAYSVVTWHIVPYGEVRGIERSRWRLTVHLKESRERMYLDVRWLGEEGLRLLMEGVNGGLRAGTAPRLVVYDGHGRKRNGTDGHSG